MAGRAGTRISESAENQYATAEEFLRIFDEDLNPLYQLSFLLMGDPQKGETCFVAGIERCAMRPACSGNGHVLGRSALSWKAQFVNSSRD